MCEYCNHEYGWDAVSIGEEKAIKLGGLGKLVMGMYLCGDYPEYSLQAELAYPQEINTKILIEIYEQINYCPMCGRKLRETD